MSERALNMSLRALRLELPSEIADHHEQIVRAEVARLVADAEAQQDKISGLEASLRDAVEGLTNMATLTPENYDAMTVAGCFHRIRGEARHTLELLADIASGDSATEKPGVIGKPEPEKAGLLEASRPRVTELEAQPSSVAHRPIEPAECAEVLERLTGWLNDVQLSARLGTPHYANPSELKNDLRVMLATLRQRGVPPDVRADAGTGPHGGQGRGIRGANVCRRCGEPYDGVTAHGPGKCAPGAAA